MRAEGVSTCSGSSSEALDPGPLPLYDGDATRESSARAQRVESECDCFGAIVTEVTTVTTVTTRRRY